MRYETPKYEVAVIETEDILTASSDKYEVERNEDGSGDILIGMGNLIG